MRRYEIDFCTMSGSRCVCRALICSTERSPRHEMLSRFVVSKACDTMTKEVHLLTTFEKHRSCRDAIGGEAGEARASRRGRGARKAPGAKRRGAAHCRVARPLAYG